MALSEQMARKLNDQVTAEFYSAYYYLGMAVAFNAMGLKVFSERFFEQYDEEIAHGMKLLRYLLDHKAPAELQEIRRPPRTGSPLSRSSRPPASTRPMLLASSMLLWPRLNRIATTKPIASCNGTWTSRSKRKRAWRNCWTW